MLKPTMLVASLCLVLGSADSTAQQFSQAECICLNNQTTATNGQFEDLVIIRSLPTDVWTVVSSDHLYDYNSPRPPQPPIPLPAGTALTHQGKGRHQLRVKRGHDTGWDAVISNGSVTRHLQSIHRCKYATLSLETPDTLCIDQPNTLSLGSDVNPLRNIAWTSDKGEITRGQGSSQLTLLLTQSDTASAHIRVSASAPSSSFNSGNMCRVTTSHDIAVDQSTQCLRALPVVYSHLSAHAIANGSVGLYWSITSSINNMGWHVQRSVDLKSWQSIAWIDAGRVSTYEWIDNNTPHVDKLYYRLVQVDYDETMSYSEVLSVGLDANDINELLLYPNPTTGLLYIAGVTLEADVRITNMQGMTIYTGKGATTIDLSSMPAGMYVCNVVTGRRAEQRAIILQ